jgi:hypothetical protein
MTERDRTVYDLARAGLPAEIISDLLKLAPAAQRVAIAGCNGIPGNAEAYWKAAERRVASAEARIGEKLPSGWRIHRSGDPRGYVLRVNGSTLRGNTWGGTNDGDDYGIGGGR